MINVAVILMVLDVDIYPFLWNIFTQKKNANIRNVQGQRGCANY